MELIKIKKGNTPKEFHQQKLNDTIKEFFFNLSANTVIEVQNDLLNFYLSNDSLILTKDQIRETISIANELSLFLIKLRETSSVLELISIKESENK